MIGIFDSGYGGLTVLKDILSINPQVDYIYLGDNARAPYGPQQSVNVIKFTIQAVTFLIERGAKIIIIACNTASSVAVAELETKFPHIKFIGVIIPTAKAAIMATKNNKIGVIGTKMTIESDSYPVSINALNPDIKVYTKACPLLVPFIEENWHHKPEAISIAKKYLRTLKSANIDVLILGCTHYPFMLKTIQRIIGKKTQILTSGKPTAQEITVEISKSTNKKQEIYTTGSADKFNAFTNRNFPSLPNAQECTINNC